MNAKSIKRVLIVFCFSLIFVVRASYAQMATPIALMLGGLIGGVFSSLFFNKKDGGSDPGPGSVVGRVIAGNVVFDVPDKEENLVLTNFSSQNVTLDDVSLSGFEPGVVTIVSSSDCQPIPAQDTCVIPLTATKDAYGSGTVTIDYDGDKQLIAGVSVAKAKIVLYRKKGSDWEKVEEPEDLIVEAETSPQYLQYVNEGNFSWQKKDSEDYIDWKSEFTWNGSVNRVDLGKCTDAIIEPNQACEFTLTNREDKDYPGGWGQLKATGKNIEPNGEVNKNVLGRGGLEIVENLDPQNLHAGYRSLKVVNTVKDKAIELTKLDPPVINPGGDKVKYCPLGDTDCDYETDPKCQEGQSLGIGESCRLWFKAKDGVLGKDENVEVKVTVEGTYTGLVNPPLIEEDTFKMKYENVLYAGGTFTQAGGQDAYRVAKWDGENWFSLGTGVYNGMNGVVNALASIGDELYVGGNFTQAGIQVAYDIAKWDLHVESWSSLELGVRSYHDGYYHPADSNVNALTSMGGNLYVGGWFNRIGESTTYIYNVAEWSPSSRSWSSLGRAQSEDVHALISMDSKLYVGGGDESGYVVELDGSSWSSLGNADGNVYVLTDVGNDLYVGGEFGYIEGMPTLASCIAKWDGSSWFPLGSGIGGYKQVYALIGMGDKYLYVGGMFTQAGGVSANRIAVWDTVEEEWSALIDSSTSANGVNGNVHAFAIVATDLIVGGSFSQAGGNPASRVAKWDTVTQTWSPLGGGVSNGVVRALITIPLLSITEHITQ